MSRQFRIMLVTLATFIVVSFYLLGVLVQSEGARPRGRASESAREAERDGLLVRRLRLATPFIVVGADTIRVREAWLERRSQVKYRYFLWGGRRMPIDGFVVAFTELNPTVLPSSIAITLNDSVRAWDTRPGAAPGRMVRYTRIADTLATSVRLGACERPGDTSAGLAASPRLQTPGSLRFCSFP